MKAKKKAVAAGTAHGSKGLVGDSDSNTGSNLVERRGQEAFTTSRALAAGAGVTHKTMIQNIRKHHGEIEELGQLAFEMSVVSSHGAGQKAEIAMLTEDQATYVLLLTRNTEKVRRFKLALVKEFRRMRKLIAKLYANPPRRDLIAGKRESAKPMLDALTEARAEAGKATSSFHFANEHLLCNYIVTGRFKAVDEASLTNEQVDLLHRVRRRNESLIAAGIPRQARKARLLRYAAKQPPMIEQQAAE